MRKAKFMSTCFLVLLIILCFYSVTFASADKKHWAKEILDDFERNGFFSGDVSILEPDNPINKGEFAVASNKYFAFDKIEFSKDDKNSFEEALAIAKEIGYMQNAKAIDYVSREEACVIFCKMIKEDAIEDEIPFTDSGEISPWAKGYVSSLSKNKIIIGYPDFSFKPKSMLTKAEFFTMLSRAKGSGGATDILPVDLVDEEIDDIEIGIIKYDSGEIKVELAGDELHMQSGDKLKLSIALPQEESDSKIYFETKDDKLVTFDEEFDLLIAKADGETQISFMTEDKKYIKIIKIYINQKEEAK